jgi:hypothetical protein
VPPALPPLIGAALTTAACYATGMVVLAGLGVKLPRSNGLERFPLAFLLGAACLHLAIFILLTLKIAYRPVLLALLGAMIFASIPTEAWRRPKTDASGESHRPASRDWSMIGFGIIFAAFTVFYFVNAWAPETSPDGSTYHLEFVSRYLRAHGFERVTTNMYATLSEGIELLFIPAFAIGRHSAASLLHLAFAITLAIEIFAYGRRIGKPRAGAAAAILTYVSPVVGIDASSAYIDLGLAAVVFSVFYWLEIWDEQRDARLLIPIGLLAGYAYAVKYTGIVILLYALGLIAWRARKIKPLLLTGACAASMMVPWMIKDWIYVRNPIAPLGNRIFRNPYLHVSTEQDWSAWLRRYDVQDKWTLPLEVTIRGQKTQGVIGPVFLAAPLALAALRFRAGRRSLVVGSLFLATYFANVGTRFLIPCLPFFSLAIALALANSRALLHLIVLFHAATSWPREVRLYADPTAWRLTKFPLQAALRRIPEDQYLRQTLEFYPMARMLEEVVPAGERILTMNMGAQAYTSREILTSFEGSLNQMLWDALESGWIREYQPTRRLVFRFPEQRVRRIRLLQVAKGEDSQQQWTVHELRFEHHGAEVPRRPEWRLRAFPNPWEVTLAFDNSPATHWSSWETAEPGTYIDVDFGHAEMADEVDMETWGASPWPIRLQVEVTNTAGQWVKIADNPEEQTMRTHSSIRHAATYEMHQRGVNYLLIGDRDFGAGEFLEDPARWGLAAVAKVNGLTLFRVIP